jgi:hypothetical protein
MAAVMSTGSESEFLVRLRKVLAEEFEIDPEAVVADANLYEDLDIDSIDAIDLIVRLKETTRSASHLKNLKMSGPSVM